MRSLLLARRTAGQTVRRPALRTTRGIVLPAVLLVALAGCGSEQGVGGGSDPGRPARPTAVPAADGPVTTARPATVLDDGTGPELCLGGVAESYPPQCSGVPLDGWDWDSVGDHERAGGVRWGDFVVTGEYDGQRLAVGDAVPAAEHPGGPAPDDPDLSTPCPEPQGGWRVLDPARTTDLALDEVLARASALEGYSDAWLDQRIPPGRVEAAVNDPTRLVVNVRVTGDPGRAEAQLRQVWGGMLCVSRAERSESELTAIARELQDLPGALTTSAARDVVHLGVVHDDGSVQAWADETYGPGVVVVSPVLVPASG